MTTITTTPLATESIVKDDLKTLLAALETIRQYSPDTLRTTLETLPEDEKTTIVYNVCKVSKFLIPDIRTKIDEHIFSYELTGSSSASASQESFSESSSSEGGERIPVVRGLINPNDHRMTVSKKPKGADLTDEEGNKYELKTSTVCSANNYKTNFSFKIPFGLNKTRDERLVVIKSDFDRLMSGPRGGAICQVASVHDGDTTHTYYISRETMILYFEKMPESSVGGKYKLPAGAKYNFGETRCSKCKEYHRMRKLCEWDAKRDLITSDCDLYKKNKPNHCPYTNYTQL